MPLKAPLTDSPNPIALAARPWRWRRREWVGLAVAWLVLSLVFILWPTLDLTVSAWFYRPAGSPGWHGFAADQFAVAGVIHETVPWFGRAASLLGLLLAIFWRLRPGPVSVGWWRRGLMLSLLMILGNGVVVNAILKENWGRPRPVDIQTFGGVGTFEPALHPSIQCDSNCSFVSGHAATGFSLLALGLIGAPATRRRWLLWGLAAGLTTGALRIAQGGHFLSDVLFSGLVIWLCGATLRAVWLHRRTWRRRRLRLAQSEEG